MGAKAVFQSQALNVYLTGTDFQDVLPFGITQADLYIGKHKVPKAEVRVMLNQPAWKALQAAAEIERKAIDANAAGMKAEAAKHKHPDPVQEDLHDGR